MTILVDEQMIFGRGVFPGATIPTGGPVTLVPDTTYLAHPGLTLLPSGIIEVTGPQGAGEWLFEGGLTLEHTSGSSRTSILVGLLFNGIEIPSTRRYVYCRNVNHGSSAHILQRLTNLIVGDQLALTAQIISGVGPIRIPTYGMSAMLSKVPR